MFSLPGIGVTLLTIGRVRVMFAPIGRPRWAIGFIIAPLAGAIPIPRLRLKPWRWNICIIHASACRRRWTLARHWNWLSVIALRPWPWAIKLSW